MRIEEIKSPVVRAILAGSPTPATDLIAKHDNCELKPEAWTEAILYFNHVKGGIHAAKQTEHNFCEELDI